MAVPVSLIDRNLAFAIAPSSAINGYYYKDLHGREFPGSDTEQIPFDYKKEWAVIAVPKEYGSTGSLLFLASNRGILAKNFRGAPLQYPHDPLQDGWQKLESREELQKYISDQHER